MGFRINTNISAMTAHMHAVNNNLGLDNSLASLSSGLRINKAADDAAGLSIANKLSAQEKGLNQAIKNSNDGIALIQTADGALKEYGDILKRVRTLAIQSANDTQNSASRDAIGAEVFALMSEADDIVKQTKFNGMKLLDGTHNGNGKFTFHTGAYANQTQEVSISTASVGTLVGTHAGANGIANIIKYDPEHIIYEMDLSLGAIDKIRSTLGAAQNKLESTVRNISVTRVNIVASESNIRDVDFAQESANLQKHNILAQSGTYAMSQANSVQQNVMKLLQ